MKRFYAGSTGGFYCDEIHGDTIPQDAVEISEDKYKKLLEGQEAGKIIAVDPSGAAILQDPPPLSSEQAIKVKIAALEAEQTPRRMREAIMGSDNGYLAEIERQIKTLRDQL